MANVSLVIKIDKEIYLEAIKSGYSHLYDEEVANAVANGTPLIDILTDFIEWENLPFPKKNVFMNAPIIIAKTYLEEKNNADID